MRGGMDKQTPDPQPSQAMACFLPPFRRGGRGGVWTISIYLTLIDALFLTRSSASPLQAQLRGERRAS